MRTKILGIVLNEVLLFTGACAPSSNNPKTATINIQIVGTELIQYWRPSTVAIAVGGTVIWQNTGPDVRNIISDQGLFNQSLTPGKSYKFVFTHAGTFTFHDDPNIETNTIIVK